MEDVVSVWGEGTKEFKICTLTYGNPQKRHCGATELRTDTIAFLKAIHLKE
jgi:hypothetical protein